MTPSSKSRSRLAESTRCGGVASSLSPMLFDVFEIAVWSSVALWLLPRGISCVWSAVKQLATS